MANIKLGTDTLTGVNKMRVQNADADGQYIEFPLPIPTQEKTATITENGTTEVTPDSGKTLSKVMITVNVPTPAPSLEEKAVTITENGTTEITPTAGKDGISKVTITTNVPQAVPIEVSTAAAMTALLVAANVGKVYRFTGTTDDTYTNGDLYEVVNG